MTQQHKQIIGIIVIITQGLRQSVWSIFWAIQMRTNPALFWNCHHGLQLSKEYKAGWCQKILMTETPYTLLLSRQTFCFNKRGWTSHSVVEESARILNKSQTCWPDHTSKDMSECVCLGEIKNRAHFSGRGPHLSRKQYDTFTVQPEIIKIQNQLKGNFPIQIFPDQNMKIIF